MRIARIYVDGRAYQGEHPDEIEPRQPSLTNGWHSHNFDTLSALQFGDVPIVIKADANIKSHLDRIFARLRNGTLKARRIVIEIEEGGL